MLLDKIKNAPWWVLLLLGFIGLPFLFNLVRRVA